MVPQYERERVRAGDPLEQPDEVYARMYASAGGLTWNLEEAWKRRVRHNERLERTALYSGLLLARECTLTLEEDRAEVLMPEGASTAQRYELQGGMRAVYYGLPFSQGERRRLYGSYEGMRNLLAFQVRKLEDNEPDLVARWHQWLWPEGTEGRWPATDDFGVVDVLAEGARRLRATIPAIAGWEDRGRTGSVQ